MKHDYTVGLGEMMNFPGITASAEPTHNITGETLKAGKIITGHYSIPETGRGLNAYIASGVRCCHESTRAEDALAKMRLGMYAMLRELRLARSAGGLQGNHGAQSGQPICDHDF